MCNDTIRRKKKRWYYLIEKYKDIDEQGPYGMYTTKEIAYNVKPFKDIKSLKKALLKGPQYEGKLSIAKDLNLKILFEENRGK